MKNAILLHGKPSIQESVSIIRQQIPGVIYREFHDMGHFTKNDMKSSEFTELLEELQK